jgi:hypothetical protein
VGAKENVALIEELVRAERDRNWVRYGELLADNVSFRLAGVPLHLAGTVQGKENVVAYARANASGGTTFSTRDIFGDDRNVCLTGRLSAPRFLGNQYLRSSDRSYSTYQCTVYNIDYQGKVASWTTYLNWLDVYTQVGLVDPMSITSPARA